MIELFSNFFLKKETDDDCTGIPSLAKHYRIQTRTIHEQMGQIVDAYKQLHPVVLTYGDKHELKYFMSLFTYQYANIKTRNEFEDVLIMNRCILL